MCHLSRCFRTPRRHAPASQVPRCHALASRTLRCQALASRTPRCQALASWTPRCQALASRTPRCQALASRTPRCQALASRTPRCQAPVSRIPHCQTPASRMPPAAPPCGTPPEFSAPIPPVPAGAGHLTPVPEQSRLLSAPPAAAGRKTGFRLSYSSVCADAPLSLADSALSAPRLRLLQTQALSHCFRTYATSGTSSRLPVPSELHPPAPVISHLHISDPDTHITPDPPPGNLAFFPKKASFCHSAVGNSHL